MIQSTGCLDKKVVKITNLAEIAHQMATTFVELANSNLPPPPSPTKSRIGPFHGELRHFVWTLYLDASNHPSPTHLQNWTFSCENFADTDALDRKFSVSFLRFHLEIDASCGFRFEAGTPLAAVAGRNGYDLYLFRKKPNSECIFYRF